MPTYKNIHPDKQRIDESLKNINNQYTQLSYNQTIKTYIRYGDSIEHLLLIDESPYWNPVLDASTVVLNDINDFQTIPVNDNTKCIEIINTSSETIYFYYQSYENTPGIPIPPGLTRTLDHLQRYTNQIVFKSTGVVVDNLVFVTQFSN